MSKVREIVYRFYGADGFKLDEKYVDQAISDLKSLEPSVEEIYQEIEIYYIEDDEKARELAKAIHKLIMEKYGNN